MQGSKRDTDVKNIHLDYVGEGEGGMIWENNMYITICKIDDQHKFNAGGRALKASALGQSRGMAWGGRWEGVQDVGTHVHLWLIHVDVRQNTEYCKVITLQLKLIN